MKNMEKDTGAKIIIRGKGSVKEGKVILIIKQMTGRFHGRNMATQGNER